jgi:hypothetical protein
MTKKILLILFTFSLSAPASFAQKLEMESQVVECGRTGYLQPVTATFELKNKGRKFTI